MFLLYVNSIAGLRYDCLILGIIGCNVGYIQNKEGHSNNIYYPNSLYTWEPQDQPNQLIFNLGSELPRPYGRGFLIHR